MTKAQLVQYHQLAQARFDKRKVGSSFAGQGSLVGAKVGEAQRRIVVAGCFENVRSKG